MSVQNVETFLDRTFTDPALMAQVHAARVADTDATLATIVQVAAQAGLSFTADEYRTKVQGEVQAIFRLHRSVAHHVLLAVPSS